MDPKRLGAALLLLMAGAATPEQEQAAKDYAKDAFVRFELRPFPKLYFDTEGKHLARGEMARAVRYESGIEEVWLSLDALRSDDLWIMLDHEACHLKTWRDHGLGVETHGREFKATCRKYALSKRACNEEYHR